MANLSDSALEEILARLDTLEASALKSLPPTTREIEAAAERAIGAALGPLLERLSETDDEISKLSKRLKAAEAYRAPKMPNVAKTVVAALEPVTDEILNIERTLKDDIKSTAARSSANALEARNAATATVLAAEVALKVAANNFAYGEE